MSLIFQQKCCIVCRSNLTYPETNMNRKLSESLEDYLEAIAELIALNGHAHTKEIAQKLNVKMPSVTGALRQLKQMGYIVYNTHYPVQLTPEGVVVAGKVVERHRVLKKFFSDILGLPYDKAYETACRLEHAVDEDTIARFTLFSEAIEMRQDAKKLQTYLTEAMGFLTPQDDCKVVLLSNLKPNTSAQIHLAGRNIPEDKRKDFITGTQVVLNGISLDKTTYHVRLGEQNTDIPAETAENIWVKTVNLS